MSKKKSEKEEKEKKQSAKKALVKAQPAAVVPEVAADVELKEAKPKARKTKAAPAKKTAKATPAISSEDIALRAYFIAERRQKMGWPGDSAGDWVEAERQLKAEAARKK